MMPNPPFLTKNKPLSKFLGTIYNTVKEADHNSYTIAISNYLYRKLPKNTSSKYKTIKIASKLNDHSQFLGEVSSAITKWCIPIQFKSIA